MAIGSCAVIMSRCVLLPGTKVPNFTMVAAGAVVRDAPMAEYGLYGGVPAKRIKELPPELAFFTRRRGPVT